MTVSKTQTANISRGLGAIGRGIAVALGQEGANIALGAVRVEDGANFFLGELRDCGVGAHYDRCDESKCAEVDEDQGRGTWVWT